VLGFLLFGGNDAQKSTHTTLSDEYILNLTYDYSKQYLDLRIRTDNILLNAQDFGSYEAWDDEMITVIRLWKQMAEHADFLEQKADAYSKTTASLNADSFFKTPVAHAYTKSVITNIYDHAPAGQGIKKLASYLGVDARRAYKILQSDQEQLKADAYIKGGKTLRNLENSQ